MSQRVMNARLTEDRKEMGGSNRVGKINVKAGVKDLQNRRQNPHFLNVFAPRQRVPLYMCDLGTFHWYTFRGSVWSFSLLEY